MIQLTFVNFTTCFILVCVFMLQEKHDNKFLKVIEILLDSMLLVIAVIKGGWFFNNDNMVLGIAWDILALLWFGSIIHNIRTFKKM